MMEVTKVWWDGEKLMAEPIDPTMIYQEPAQPDSICNNTLRIQGKAYPRSCKKCGLGPCVELAQQALEKMANNARELGLDYESARQQKPVTLKWQQAPLQTAWGDEMVVASVAIDKDHTVDLYCERDQTPKVEAMFQQRPWVGLSEDDIDGLIEATDLSGAYYYDDMYELARKIEAKLKERNQ